MKLIDCFMYFDEDLVLDIRLNTLNDIVDRFVIVEATTDHAGNQKKLNFNKKNFKKFENKIHYIVDQNLPEQVSFFKKIGDQNGIGKMPSETGWRLVIQIAPTKI